MTDANPLRLHALRENSLRRLAQRASICKQACRQHSFHALIEVYTPNENKISNNKLPGRRYRFIFRT